MFSWNCGPWWFIKCLSRNTKLLPRAPDNIEVLWSETIGLCKIMSIIYRIITCDPEPQANGPGHEQIKSFELNQFIKSDWSFWTSSRLEQHRSTSYSIKSHFQTPDSHSDWKWDTVAAYLILWWWMNGSSNSPWTEETARTEDRWAADILKCEPNTWMKGPNERFYGFSSLM